MPKEILSFNQVSFKYHSDREALKSVSVKLYEGERVAVLGNNGAGKSTFFLCCNGILKPSKGEIALNERVIVHNKVDTTLLRQTVGLVFQDPDSQMIAGTVESEISFGPMNLKLSKDLVLKRVNEAIEKMNLEPLRTRAPHYLSGGEKKRVSIADVLAMSPKLMLFDEPTASLDPANSLLLEKNLKELHENGLGIIISTHDVDFAWKWADRILVFHAGQLIADDKPEVVFANEVLLKQAGLVQPTLYQVAKVLGLMPIPKTIEDLKDLQNKSRSISAVG